MTPELTVEAEGDHFGAREIAYSIYVRDSDNLLVEFRGYPEQQSVARCGRRALPSVWREFFAPDHVRSIMESAAA